MLTRNAFCVYSVLRKSLTRLAGPAVASLAAIAGPAAAQPLDYGALEELFGEAVTSSVTGSPQIASDVPASMEIITADAIRRSGAYDIPGILQHVTGINVLRWTNNGVDVGIRGYNKAFSARLLVLVNGRQVYADHYGYTPWSSIPVELGEIRQIEIVKGPNSALFGFNAVGGVINIITFSPAHEAVNYVAVRGGTQQLLTAAAGTTFSLAEDWDVRVSAGARENEDFSTPLRRANIGSRRGDKRASLRVDSHYALRPDVTLEVEASWTGTEQSNMVPIYLMAFEKLRVASLQLSLHADTRAGLVHASLYRNQVDNKGYTGIFDGQNVVEPDVPIVDFSNELTVAQLYDIFKPGNAHTLRLSADYRESTLNTSPVSGGNVHYDVLSGGAMWQWELNAALAMTTAVRRDYLQLGRRGAMPPGFGLANAAWDRSLAQTSFNLGFVWQLDDRNTLRLTTARGAQLPSLFDLGGNLVSIPPAPELGFPDGLYYAGVPDLQPSIVTSHELAWDRKLSMLDAELRVAVFRGRSRAVMANYGNYLPQFNILSAAANIGDSKTTGLELTLAGRLGQEWQWNLGYLQQDVDDSFSPLFPAGLTYTDFATTTPRHTVNAGLGWTRGAWSGDVRALYVADFMSIRNDDEYIYDVLAPAFPQVLYAVDAYTSVDARIAWNAGEAFSVSLSGQNLFNSEQRQTAGPNVERRVMASLTRRF